MGDDERDDTRDCDPPEQHDPPWVTDVDGNELVRLVDGKVEYAKGHDARSVAKALADDPHLSEWFAGLLERGDA